MFRRNLTRLIGAARRSGFRSQGRVAEDMIVSLLKRLERLIKHFTW